MQTWWEFTANDPKHFKSEKDKFAWEESRSEEYHVYVGQEFDTLGRQDHNSPEYKERRHAMAMSIFGGVENCKPFADRNSKAKEMGLLDPNNNIPHKEFAEKVQTLRKAAVKENLNSWAPHVDEIDAKKQGIAERGNDAEIKADKLAIKAGLDEACKAGNLEDFNRYKMQAAKYSGNGFTREVETYYDLEFAKSKQLDGHTKM